LGKEEDMSRFKLFAFIILITMAFGVTLVGDALAGEKGKVVGGTQSQL
jgi:hypothetical protein